MSETELSPVASHVIGKCGGVAIVSRITGRAPVTVHKWRHSREKGGTGGLIPSEAQAKLMAAARRGEIQLTPADFFEAGGEEQA